MHRSPFLMLLLLASAPFLCAAASNRDRALSNHLNTKLFAMADVLNSIERHMSRLDDWQLDLQSLESRLQSSEESVMQKLTHMQQALAQCQQQQTTISQRLEAVEMYTHDLSNAVIMVKVQMSNLSTALAGNSEEVRGVSTALGGQLTTIGDRLTQLAAHQDNQFLAAQNSRDAGFQEARQMLQSNITTLGEQVQQVHAQLQLQDGQLQQALVTTTPAPTANPQKLFLRNFLQDLRRRNRN